MSSIQKSFFIVIISWFFFSCNNDRFDVDVSSVTLHQEQVRLDVALKATPEISQDHAEIFNKHPLIYTVYYQDILKLGDIKQPASHENMLGFLKDPMMKDIQNEIDKSFPEEEIYKSEFTEAFKRYKYHFPNELIPNIALYNSGLNYGVYPTPDFIGLGLDWYIGNDNKLLERLPPSQFPKYLKDKMQADYIVSDALRGYLLVKYSDKIDGKQLLNQLVYFGKVAFMMDACMPSTPAYLKFGYQEAQAEWCVKNEFQIWKSLVNEDLLYSKDRKLINGFIGNAPFTKGFSDQSPGKLAFFIGKMMVEDYADANEDVTIQQLLDVPSTDILKAYRPNK